MRTNNVGHNLGKEGERLAMTEYVRLGYILIRKNVRIHGYRQIGEIDLIFRRDREIVFVEVKTRKSARFGTPADAVGYLKQRRLRKAVGLYLLQHPQYDGWDWRIDVVEVHIDKSENPVIMLVNAIEDVD
jgi:putative endonuclease